VAGLWLLQTTPEQLRGCAATEDVEIRISPMVADWLTPECRSRRPSGVGMSEIAPCISLSKDSLLGMTSLQTICVPMRCELRNMA